MMVYGGEEWTGFPMQDLQEFCGKYGEDYVSHKVKSMFNFVPSKALDEDDDDSIKWRMYADYVKPTAKIELMQVSKVHRQKLQRLYQHAFVP